MLLLISSRHFAALWVHVLVGAVACAASLSITAQGPGHPASYAVMLKTQPGESVSGLQFDVELASGQAAIEKITTGPAAAAAKKDLYANPLTRLRQRVIIAGLNQNTIGNGPVAVVMLKSPVPEGASELVLTNIVMSDPQGHAVKVVDPDQPQETAPAAADANPMDAFSIALICVIILAIAAAAWLFVRQKRTSASKARRARTSSLFLVGMLGLILGGQAMAATLTIDFARGTAGTNVVLPIQFDPAGSSVTGLQFDLIYDAGSFDLVDLAAGAVAVAAGKDLQFSTIAPGHLRAIVAGLNRTAISAGIAAELTLGVKPATPAAVYPVQLSGVLLSDVNGQSVSVSALDGGVYTGTGNIIDINADGLTNAVDVQQVINALLGLDTHCMCDANGDGTLDAQDVQLVINGVLGIL